MFVAQDHRFVYANDTLPRMLGYARDEFVGLSFDRVVAPDTLPLWTKRYDARIGDGSMGFDFAGTYTKILEHKRIEYAFGDRKAEVDFVPGPKGVVVRVAFDGETTHSLEQQQAGWQAILDSFARYVEAKQKAS